MDYIPGTPGPKGWLTETHREREWREIEHYCLPKEQQDFFQFTKQAEVPGSKIGRRDIRTFLLDTTLTEVPSLTKEFTKEEVDKVLSLLKPGDILLTNDDTLPGLQLVEKVVARSDFTHAAIYEGNGRTIEAGAGGVVRDNLKNSLTGSKKNLEIIRPNYKTPEDVNAALKYARSQLKKPYNSSFDLYDDKKIYCTELVHNALLAIPNPIKTNPPNKFLGKDYLGPDAFRGMADSQVVYSTGCSFTKSQLSRSPIYAGAVTASLVGGFALGMPGAVAGFIGGATATTFMWKKGEEYSKILKSLDNFPLHLTESDFVIPT
jgi:hypothetical protein